MALISRAGNVVHVPAAHKMGVVYDSSSNEFKEEVDEGGQAVLKGNTAKVHEYNRARRHLREKLIPSTHPHTNRPGMLGMFALGLRARGLGLS